MTREPKCDAEETLAILRGLVEQARAAGLPEAEATLERALALLDPPPPSRPSLTLPCSPNAMDHVSTGQRSH